MQLWSYNANDLQEANFNEQSVCETWEYAPILQRNFAKSDFPYLPVQPLLFRFVKDTDTQKVFFF